MTCLLQNGTEYISDLGGMPLDPLSVWWANPPEICLPTL